ncbi:MAG: DUF5810 domain-containing protein [Haloferacaceae archaeon]
MGYACPVCEAPQRDAEHLANHLAFTALLHGDDHEAWLDEHAPDWAESDPEALGERVAPHAEETTYEEVFEDTAHEHERGRPFADEGGPLGAGLGGREAEAGSLDETARAALAEARELTREMRDGDDHDGSDDEEKA